MGMSCARPACHSTVRRAGRRDDVMASGQALWSGMQHWGRHASEWGEAARAGRVAAVIGSAAGRARRTSQWEARGETAGEEQQ